MAKIGFLGAGLMGAAMVEAMLRRGDEVAVWNRTAGKAKALERLGARAAATPAEAVAGAERIHAVLSDDAAVDAVLEQAAPGLERGALVVDHTTVSPAGTVARYRRWGGRGVPFLHAPVFMAPQNCREATGLMLCGGPRDRFALAEPALRRMTGDVWYVGEREDLAAAYKLFGNAMILAIVGGLADVFQMARQLGVEPVDAHALFSRFNPAGVVQYRGRKMAEANFEPAFELAMARKDVRLMVECAAAAPLAVLPGLAARMDQVIAAGRGRDDVGVIGAG